LNFFFRRHLFNPLSKVFQVQGFEILHDLAVSRAQHRSRKACAMLNEFDGTIANRVRRALKPISALVSEPVRHTSDHEHGVRLGEMTSSIGRVEGRVSYSIEVRRFTTTSNACAGVSTAGALQNGLSISKPLRSRPDREEVQARHFLEASSPKRSWTWQFNVLLLKKFVRKINRCREFYGRLVVNNETSRLNEAPLRSILLKS